MTSAQSRRRRGRRVLFGLALLFVWASGVNMATHHWWGAAGELALAALLLLVASVDWEAVFEPGPEEPR